MKRIVFVLLILSFLSNNCLAQPESVTEKNVRLEHRFGASAKLGGAYGILAGIAVDAFVTPHINAELNFSPIPILSNIRYYGGGLNIHPLGGSNSRWSPYLGFFYGHASGKAFLSGEDEEYSAANFPVGVQYIHSNGLSFSVELGLAWVRETTDFHPFYRDEFYPPPSIKIGFRF